MLRGQQEYLSPRVRARTAGEAILGRVGEDLDALGAPQDVGALEE